ncbi:MAG TPA: sugar phosphate isomerase/epimerase [Tepidisphaeraceae bacterium]|nr:sugar phosphate isomerase/epimerase [Tepidisphaeraceae bacterium]
MLFGICAPLEDAEKAKAAGADFIEANAQSVLRGLVGDDQWSVPELVGISPKSIPAFNVLVPGDLKITGPQANLARLRDYMECICRRASQYGGEVLVFGSAGARAVPEGFDRDKAKCQVVDFLSMGGTLAGEFGLTIVIEPLSRSECNFINLVDESLEIAKLVNLPTVQCLVDSYHFWVNGDSLECLKEAAPHIYHVHVADQIGRVAPGLSGSVDYLPLFRVLKGAGYNRRISIEALNFDLAADGRRAMNYLKQQWQAA